MDEFVIKQDGPPLKVEVVNFETISDHAVKMVVGAIAVTVATKLAEKGIEAAITRAKARKAAKEAAKTEK